MLRSTSPPPAAHGGAPRPSADPVADPADEARRLVERLARPAPGGGHVVDRASLLAAGTGFAAAVAYIEARSGEAVHAGAPSGRGLHGLREASGPGPVLRYLLPPGAIER